MSGTEKLIDDFLQQVDLLGEASPELQQQLAELLRAKRATLIAKRGRPRTHGLDRRDFEIYQAYLALKAAGNKVKEIEQSLGTKYSRSPERIKSIVQDWKAFIG